MLSLIAIRPPIINVHALNTRTKLEITGDWVITDTEVHQLEKIEITDGDIIIKPTGSLTLKSCTVIFKSVSKNDFCIRIAGTLYAYNTDFQVEGLLSMAEIYVVAGANVHIELCTITDYGTLKYGYPTTIAVNLPSSVEIYDTDISPKLLGGGIYVANLSASPPTGRIRADGYVDVQGTKIFNTYYDFVYITKSSLTISECGYIDITENMAFIDNVNIISKLSQDHLLKLSTNILEIRNSTGLHFKSSKINKTYISLSDEISFENVSISNLTSIGISNNIVMDNITLQSDESILINMCENVTILNSNITVSQEDALLIANCENVTINNTHVTSQQANGTIISSSNRITINNSEIKGVFYGVYIKHSNSIEISNSTISVGYIPIGFYVDDLINLTDVKIVNVTSNWGPVEFYDDAKIDIGSQQLGELILYKCRGRVKDTIVSSAIYVINCEDLKLDNITLKSEETRNYAYYSIVALSENIFIDTLRIRHPHLWLMSYMDIYRCKGVTLEAILIETGYFGLEVLRSDDVTLKETISKSIQSLTVLVIKNLTLVDMKINAISAIRIENLIIENLTIGTLDVSYSRRIYIADSNFGYLRFIHCTSIYIDNSKQTNVWSDWYFISSYNITINNTDITCHQIKFEDSSFITIVNTTIYQKPYFGPQEWYDLSALLFNHASNVLIYRVWIHGTFHYGITLIESSNIRIVLSNITIGTWIENKELRAVNIENSNSIWIYGCNLTAWYNDTQQIHYRYSIWIRNATEIVIYANYIGGNVSDDVALYYDNEIVGNYWNLYSDQISDANGDGISETPIEIDENSIDRYPLTYEKLVDLLMGIALSDMDRDGISDEEEVNIGTNPYDPDTDGDGIIDGDELAIGTNPLNNDTDYDGISDYEEINLGTDPTNADSDGDGLTDSYELTINTDPLSNDTDDDGLLDGEEISLRTDPLHNDTDYDGLLDGEEIAIGTSPLSNDSDLDGLSDYDEIYEFHTDPTLRDTDGDGYIDSQEIIVGTDPLDPEDYPIETKKKSLLQTIQETIIEYLPLVVLAAIIGFLVIMAILGYIVGVGIARVIVRNSVRIKGLALIAIIVAASYVVAQNLKKPKYKPILLYRSLYPWENADSDNDGLPDSLEIYYGLNPSNPDCDGDGIPDGKELLWNLDIDGDGLINARDKDSDGDGLPDSVEDRNHNGIVDDGETDLTNPDSDYDGLLDGKEDINANGIVDPNETDPLNNDTDGDGLPDGREYNPFMDEDGDGLINARDKDSDNDGLDDYFEVIHNLNPTSNDTDNDGLTDSFELEHQLDPTDPDSDGDGLIDSLEMGENGRPVEAECIFNGTKEFDVNASGLKAIKFDTGRIHGVIEDVPVGEYFLYIRIRSERFDITEEKPIIKVVISINDAEIERILHLTDYYKVKLVDGESVPIPLNIYRWYSMGILKIEQISDIQIDIILISNFGGYIFVDKILLTEINAISRTDPTMYDTDNDGIPDKSESLPRGLWLEAEDFCYSPEQIICNENASNGMLISPLTNGSLCKITLDLVFDRGYYTILVKARKDNIFDPEIYYLNVTLIVEYLTDDEQEMNLVAHGNASIYGPYTVGRWTLVYFGERWNNSLYLKHPAKLTVIISCNASRAIYLDKIAILKTRIYRNTLRVFDFAYKVMTQLMTLHTFLTTGALLSIIILVIAILYRFTVEQVNYTKDTDLLPKFTDPLDPDTDGEGIAWGEASTIVPHYAYLTDGYERKIGLNPLDIDSDNDGLLAIKAGFLELSLKSIDSLDTNPLSNDTDNDGLADWCEDRNFNGEWDSNETNWLDADTDDDGILDGNEDLNANGIVDEFETDPLKRDTDEDGLLDGIEVGLMAPQNETATENWPERQIDDGRLSITDPRDWDTDNDGLPDGWIDFDKDGEKDLGEFEDKDLDGILDYGDWNGGKGVGETDPTNIDTDGDWESDYSEIINGLDPLVQEPINFRIKEVSATEGHARQDEFAHVMVSILVENNANVSIPRELGYKEGWRITWRIRITYETENELYESIKYYRMNRILSNDTAKIIIAINLPPGEHTVTIELEGYYSKGDTKIKINETEYEDNIYYKTIRVYGIPEITHFTSDIYLAVYEIPLSVTVNFEFTYVDPDNDVTTFMWDFDGDGEYDLTLNEPENVSWTYTEEGVFAARLKIIDEQGHSALDTILVTITVPSDVDLDGDGLTHGEEALRGTDDYNPDTDGDGLLDGMEVLLGLSPLQVDTDGDNLDDFWEVALLETYGADPFGNSDFDNDGFSAFLDADADGDGIPDGSEIYISSVTSESPQIVMKTNPFAKDTDLDGLDDNEELQWGTDPSMPDTDGDGLTDYQEIKVYLEYYIWEEGTEVYQFYDPLDPDTDGDHIPDKYDFDDKQDSMFFTYYYAAGNIIFPTEIHYYFLWGQAYRGDADENSWQEIYPDNVYTMPEEESFINATNEAFAGSYEVLRIASSTYKVIDTVTKIYEPWFADDYKVVYKIVMRNSTVLLRNTETVWDETMSHKFIKIPLYSDNFSVMMIFRLESDGDKTDLEEPMITLPAFLYRIYRPTDINEIPDPYVEEVTGEPYKEGVAIASKGTTYESFNIYVATIPVEYPYTNDLVAYVELLPVWLSYNKITGEYSFSDLLEAYKRSDYTARLHGWIALQVPIEPNGVDIITCGSLSDLATFAARNPGTKSHTLEFYEVKFFNMTVELYKVTVKEQAQIEYYEETGDLRFMHRTYESKEKIFEKKASSWLEVEDIVEELKSKFVNVMEGETKYNVPIEAFESAIMYAQQHAMDPNSIVVAGTITPEMFCIIPSYDGTTIDPRAETGLTLAGDALSGGCEYAIAKQIDTWNTLRKINPNIKFSDVELPGRLGKFSKASPYIAVALMIVNFGIKVYMASTVSDPHLKAAILAEALTSLLFSGIELIIETLLCLTVVGAVIVFIWEALKLLGVVDKIKEFLKEYLGIDFGAVKRALTRWLEARAGVVPNELASAALSEAIQKLNESVMADPGIAIPVY